jgi:hypothetical protein
LVLTRTLTYLPRGIAYALFAPFPWSIQRPIDALVIPDVLVWYVLMVGAGWSVVARRDRWRLYLPLVLFVCLMIGLYSLVEGNLGTLYRHRVITLVPLVAALAGCGLSAAASRVTRLRARA